MKILAKRSFRNTGRRISLPNAVHPDHIHKGSIFCIGDEKTPFKELNEADRAFVYLLNAADCLAEPTPENIAKVQADIAVEAKVEARSPATLRWV